MAFENASNNLQTRIRKHLSMIDRQQKWISQKSCLVMMQIRMGVKGRQEILLPMLRPAH